MQSVFRPLQAAIGGLLIGTAVGMYMLLAKKIGGHSGMLKSLVVGPREASKLTYLLGLAVAGEPGGGSGGAAGGGRGVEVMGAGASFHIEQGRGARWRCLLTFTLQENTVENLGVWAVFGHIWAYKK